MGNYKCLSVENLKELNGGNRWTNASIGAVTGLGGGFQACKFFGPWWATGCAVGGALVLGAAGYYQN